MLLPPPVDALIDLALAEDLGLGDVTSEAIFPPDHRCRAHVVAKQELILCGLGVAARVATRLAAGLAVTPLRADGDLAHPGDLVLLVAGPTRAVLAVERTLLNFLQRLSGVATQTRRYVAAAAPWSSVRVVDTRKTTPGWRALEKYAVRCGGGHNHRSTLGEHVLIKDNHIAAAGSIARAVAACRDRAPHGARIECEVTSLLQLDEALAAGADVVLLDNFSPEGVQAAVARAGGRAVLEVSGGVTLETLAAYAAAGPDIISIGALTHSARAVDLSLEVEAGT